MVLVRHGGGDYSRAQFVVKAAGVGAEAQK
jgi:hypothetical protein